MSTVFLICLLLLVVGRAVEVAAPILAAIADGARAGWEQAAPQPPSTPD